MCRINHFEYKIPCTLNELHMNDRPLAVNEYASKAEFQAVNTNTAVCLQTKEVGLN